MQKHTYHKNTARVFLNSGTTAPDLTTDPRRWARAFRFETQSAKVRRNPAAAGRATAKAVRNHYAKKAAGLI